jgi:hypothetical protein
MSVNMPNLSQLDKIILAIEKGNFKERQIDLSDESLGDEGVFRLVDALIGCISSNVEEINLTGNEIGDNAAKRLATIKNLKKLIASENNIGPQGAQALAGTMLEELDLNGNPIQNEGIHYLAQNKTLSKLKAAGCEISSKGASEFFSTNTSVKELDFSENNIGNEGVSELHRNSTLQGLDLTHTLLTYQGAEFISKNRSLKILNLTSNSLGDKGAQALCRTSLEKICLINNGIGDAGIASFAHSKQLQELIMSGNYVTSMGVITLLTTNKSLLSLNLSNNNLDDKCISELMASKSLVEVNLFGNNFTDKSEKLVRELIETSSIQSINISNNVVKRGLFIAYANKSKPALTPSEIDLKNNSPRKQ